MLRKPDGSDQVTAMRFAAFDRARTFIILLVLLYHSVVNYCYFGDGDKMRWLGFDLVALFTDSFFMACMFLISGLFVWAGLTRKGSAAFLRGHAWRLGVPYLVSVFVLVPIAYYPTFLRYHRPDTTDFSFLHFWWHMLAVGPWPSGPAWFLWVLLALDVAAAAVRLVAPRVVQALGWMIFSVRNRPALAFAGFAMVSIAAYLPMHLAFGGGSWLELSHFPLPIQTSRILLYTAYFFIGVGVGSINLKAGILAENGKLARRWPVWLGAALLCYGALIGLVYVQHNWLADFKSPPLLWNAGYGLAFATFSAAMTFTVLAFFLRFAETNWRLLDALQPSSYGIYLVHYIFITWLQYAIYDTSFPAGVKFTVVFAGTLAASWPLAALLQKIPVVARMI
jgi:surface polysaccharide O-acyltransferase-like enzyme